MNSILIQGVLLYVCDEPDMCYCMYVMSLIRATVCMWWAWYVLLCVCDEPDTCYCVYVMSLIRATVQLCNCLYEWHNVLLGIELMQTCSDYLPDSECSFSWVIKCTLWYINWRWDEPFSCLCYSLLRGSEIWNVLSSLVLLIAGPHVCHNLSWVLIPGLSSE